MLFNDIIIKLELKHYYLDKASDISRLSSTKDLFSFIENKKELTKEISLYKETDKAFFTSGNLMILPYTLAKTNDNQSMWKMFYHILREKIQLLHLLLYSSPQYDIPILKVSHSLLSLNVMMVLNALCFRDSLISHNYHKDFFQYYYIVLNSTVICVLSIIFSRCTITLITIHPYINLLMPERHDHKTFESLVRNMMDQFSIRINIFFALCLIVNLFSCYYCTIFCIIYSQTQTTLLYSVLISLGLSLGAQLLLCLLTALMRYYSLINQKKYLYLTSTYIHNVI